MRGALPILALALCAAALADDEKKPVVVAAPDQAVTEARQDLDALKRSAAAGTNPLVGLPAMQAPDLNPTGGYVAPLPLTDPAKLKAAKHDDNWLVDGVLGQQRTDALHDLSTRDGVLKSKADEREAILKEALQASAGKQSPKSTAMGQPATDDYGFAETLDPAPAAPSRPPEFKADNPLNAFMSSWISTHDSELLKPVAANAGSTAAPLTPTPADPASLDLMVAAHEGPASAPAPATLKDPGNPFVDFINSPVVAAPVPEVSYHPAPAPAIAPPPPTPGPAEAKTVVPDYARGMMDDPALKQAKRF